MPDTMLRIVGSHDAAQNTIFSGRPREYHDLRFYAPFELRRRLTGGAYFPRLGWSPHPGSGVQWSDTGYARYAFTGEFAHVGLNRSELGIHALVLDIDGPRSVTYARAAFASALVPMPTIVTTNPLSGNIHAYWSLADTVNTHSGASEKAQRYFRYVSDLYVWRLQADWNYNGLLTRNPCHPWNRPEWRATDPYTLGDLCAVRWIDEGREALRQRATERKARLEACKMLRERKGLQAVLATVKRGQRNATLFEEGCIFAGARANAARDMLDELARWNGLIAEPLPSWEIADIAASVERYRAGDWTYDGGMTDAEFSQLQSWRGQRSGQARRKRTAERDQNIRAWHAGGMKQRQIGRLTGLTQSTVSRVLARKYDLI